MRMHLQAGDLSFLMHPGVALGLTEFDLGAGRLEYMGCQSVADYTAIQKSELLPPMVLWINLTNIM